MHTFRVCAVGPSCQSFAVSLACTASIISLHGVTFNIPLGGHSRYLWGDIKDTFVWEICNADMHLIFLSEVTLRSASLVRCWFRSEIRHLTSWSKHLFEVSLYHGDVLVLTYLQVGFPFFHAPRPPFYNRSCYGFRAFGFVSESPCTEAANQFFVTASMSSHAARLHLLLKPCNFSMYWSIACASAVSTTIALAANICGVDMMTSVAHPVK